MKLFLFYLCIYGLIKHSNSNKNKKVGSGAGVNLKLKPVMCTYLSQGPIGLDDSAIPTLLPQNIPKACEIILFYPVYIDTNSTITCDVDILKQVSQLKNVILGIGRLNGYPDWVEILTPQGNEKDVNALVNFAQQYNVLGFKFSDLNPSLRPISDSLNVNIGHYIIPYIKQIKALKPNYIIGLTFDVAPPILKNPCVAYFDQLNGLVDYYEMNTIVMSYYCEPAIYNGFTPLHKRKHGPDYIMSIEDAIDVLKTTKCDLSKVYLIVELYPFDQQGPKYMYSYTEVCSGKNLDSWCIQNTNDYFQKGKYVKAQNYGLSIVYLNLDNINAACGCSPFAGVRNIIAGYSGGQHAPCPKYDVHKSMESY